MTRMLLKHNYVCIVETGRSMLGNLLAQPLMCVGEERCSSRLFLSRVYIRGWASRLRSMDLPVAIIHT